MDKSTQILNILTKYNAKKDQGTDWPYIKSAVEGCVLSNQPLKLINFTCSTINPKYMFDSLKPELYVNLDPSGNNLEIDLPKLTSMYEDLRKLYTIQIIILIGNTDPFYIYTEEASKLPISEEQFWEKFSKRWAIYKQNLEKYIKNQYPSFNFEVVSWYELEQEWKNFGWDFRKQYKLTLQNISNYYDESDFIWELSKLNAAFGEGKYFYNLKRPPTSTLKRWVKRKFSEYTVQGLWIKQIFPNAILLQNEKPSDLRTKMYQPLVKKLLDSRLPVLYPYGIDNSGYQ